MNDPDEISFNDYVQVLYVRKFTVRVHYINEYNYSVQ